MLQPRAQNQRNRLGVFGGNLRKARFDATDSQFVELPGDLQLLLRTEDDADGLLAVAKSSVVETDGSRAIEFRTHIRPRIEFAGPDLSRERAHRVAPCDSVASAGDFVP